MLAALPPDEPSDASALLPHEDDEDALETDCKPRLIPTTAAMEHSWQCSTADPINQIARRADLLISHAGYYGYADVSVAHSFTTTLVNRSSRRVEGITPLTAALEREKSKERLYKQCEAYKDYEVTPFVVESLGGIGPMAMALLRKLTKLTQQPTAMLQRAIDIIAVALVKGNRILEKAAIPRLKQTLHILQNTCAARSHPGLMPGICLARGVAVAAA
jgi:hypothetical protein